jgi:hypothetical protein
MRRLPAPDERTHAHNCSGPAARFPLGGPGILRSRHASALWRTFLPPDLGESVPLSSIMRTRRVAAQPVPPTAAPKPRRTRISPSLAGERTFHRAATRCTQRPARSYTPDPDLAGSRSSTTPWVGEPPQAVPRAGYSRGGLLSRVGRPPSRSDRPPHHPALRPTRRRCRPCRPEAFQDVDRVARDARRELSVP